MFPPRKQVTRLRGVVQPGVGEGGEIGIWGAGFPAHLRCSDNLGIIWRTFPFSDFLLSTRWPRRISKQALTW